MSMIPYCLASYISFILLSSPNTQASILLNLSIFGLYFGILLLLSIFFNLERQRTLYQLKFYHNYKFDICILLIH